MAYLNDEYVSMDVFGQKPTSANIFEHCQEIQFIYIQGAYVGYFFFSA